MTLAVILAGSWAYAYRHTARNISHSVTMQHATVLSYHGQQGIDALTLLRRHAAIGVRHYSFGDMVTSINGVTGAGPKYWTFYVNGTEATSGAGSYITKSSDTITWKLQ